MGKLFGVLIVIAVLIAGGLAYVSRSSPQPTPVEGRAELLAVPPIDLSRFARAIGPYDWHFPADYGAHPAFQTEWWYYTGNLAAPDGQRFGYQFTIFRRALMPAEAPSASEWRTNQVYMAHFTITDVSRGAFHQFQRFSRGSDGLAGATTQPRYRVWLEDWEVRALDEAATQSTITARAPGVALDLRLDQVKPPALQGDRGLSAKSSEPGSASYYYSLSRLITGGTLTVGGQSYTVQGTSWMDHEFSTSALGPTAQGWDWFGLHLDDQRDLMLGQIRLESGGTDPAFGGLLIRPDGTTRYLSSGDFTIRVTATWTSPHTGAVYPAGWDMVIETGDREPLHLTLAPLVADQELTEGIRYWEGAVQISGDAQGYGYAELTGYQGSMRERF